MKKPGYYWSEAEFVKEVQEKTCNERFLSFPTDLYYGSGR